MVIFAGIGAAFLALWLLPNAWRELKDAKGQWEIYQRKPSWMAPDPRRMARHVGRAGVYVWLVAAAIYAVYYLSLM